MGGALGEIGEKVDGDNCSFNVHYELSSVIGTVGIVRWSTDLLDLSEAEIEFGRENMGWELSAPVQLARPDYRTLLLGMKGDTTYRFRIVAHSGSKSCTSSELSISTDPVPDFVPTLYKTATSPRESKGFIVTTPGLDLAGIDRGWSSVFIFDTDGDVVWWTPDTTDDIAAARLGWDGRIMWYASAYRGLWSLTMDGQTAREYPNLQRATHDLAVLPSGGIATMLEGSTLEGMPSSVVELRPNGNLVTIVSDITQLYDGGLHTNAIHYYPEDDTFTLSDYIANCFVKFRRNGELVWQLGGKEPALGNSFQLVGLDLWEDNHGHHFTSDGKFLFFNNEPTGSTSNLIELELDETAWTAIKTWEHNSEFSSPFLGDVQRLPNGNVLASYSVRGLLEEITPNGELLQQYDFWAAEDADLFSLPTFGYANFRTSLYGPPPR
jgi:hypothetical protein